MNHSQLFQGSWIGRSIGVESPAHVWDIDVTLIYFQLKTRWENQTSLFDMTGYPVSDEPAFKVGNSVATLIDSQHFVIPKWDTNEVRGGKGPAYDVVFSRPGLAELTAEQVYADWKKAQRKKK